MPVATPAEVSRSNLFKKLARQTAAKGVIGAQGFFATSANLVVDSRAQGTAAFLRSVVRRGATRAPAIHRESRSRSGSRGEKKSPAHVSSVAGQNETKVDNQNFRPAPARAQA